MPITQKAIMDQMQEARAAHTYGRQLRDQMLAMLAVASRKYVSNETVQEVLTVFVYHLRNAPPPDDRVTWLNEHHYRRVAKRNNEMRERQDIQRRMAGVPTKEEAIAILLAKNELRRANLPVDPSDYILPQIQPAAAKTGVRPIMPRNDPDDAPLEFDLPPGATIDLGGPKLLDENNLLTGVDIPTSTDDNAIGNGAKES